MPRFNTSLLILYFLLFKIATCRPKNNENIQEQCEKCVKSGKEWCTSNNSCNVIWCPMENAIFKPVNCPKAHDGFEYDDEFIRKKILITTAAVNSDNPQVCFDNQMSTMKLYNTYDVNCTSLPPAVSCFAYTSVDDTQKVIAIAFRGTQNNLQLTEEFLTYFFNTQQKFFNHGSIFSYFYDAFQFLWTGGLEEDVRQLRQLYPKYEIWINGHSMGGALASIAASYIVELKYWKADHIKLVTMGQPRVGDYDFAVWHGKTFPYSYRIVHDRDIIPHVPPQIAIGYNLYHHRSQVWYPNDMRVGDPFTICDTADGYYCSDTLAFNYTLDDHGLYFVKEMPAWGGLGCPTLWIP